MFRIYSDFATVWIGTTLWFQSSVMNINTSITSYVIKDGRKQHYFIGKCYHYVYKEGGLDALLLVLHFNFEYLNSLFFWNLQRLVIATGNINIMAATI